jgi:hypothetical protein
MPRCWHDNHCDPRVLGRRVLGLLPVAACLLVACGSDGWGPATATGPATPAASRPALASPPAKAGEHVFTGDSSPAEHGPIALDGDYVVRFEQIAPEDPKLDFSTQTAFTAELQRRAGDPSGAVRLFSAAHRTGRRELTIHGRYVLNVTFGDFPYAIRFTPRRPAPRARGISPRRA